MLLGILSRGVPPGPQNPDPISAKTCHFPNPFSRKPRKRFGPAKPVLDICVSTSSQVYTPETSCMKRTSVHIKNICEYNSSVIIRFETLRRLSGCENISGPSRNGPLWPQKSIPVFRPGARFSKVNSVQIPFHFRYFFFVFHKCKIKKNYKQRQN